MASVCASADEAKESKENRMRRPWLFGSRRTKKGGSINGGYPFMMVDFMENPNLKWMMTGGSLHLGNPHVSSYL